MTRRLRRRLRTIAARAALCALVFAAISSVGARQSEPDPAPAQASLLSP